MGIRDRLFTSHLLSNGIHQPLPAGQDKGKAQAAEAKKKKD
jgi:hypothetical protein